MRTTKDQVVANGKHSNGATARKNGSSAEAESGDSALARAFAAFARVGEKLEKARDVDELLRSIVHEVRELVGVERCSIYLREEKAGLFRGCVGEGGERDMDSYVKRSLAGMPADGMTLELLRTKRPVIIANARKDPRIMRATARFWEIHSMLAVPMIFNDEVIGVIFLDDVERPHVFTAGDVEIATVFARPRRRGRHADPGAARAALEARGRGAADHRAAAGGRGRGAHLRPGARGQRARRERGHAGGGAGQAVRRLRRRQSAAGDRQPEGADGIAAAPARAAVRGRPGGSRCARIGRQQPSVPRLAASRRGRDAPPSGRADRGGRRALGTARGDGVQDPLRGRRHGRPCAVPRCSWRSTCGPSAARWRPTGMQGPR